MKAVIRILYFLLSLLLISVSLFARQQAVLEGTVVDENKETLPYVRLSIGKHPITLTNGEGRFSLKVSTDRSSKDSVALAYMGYKTLKLAVAGLSSPVTIQLEPDVLQLKEVAISAINAAGVIREAMAHVPQNYPMQPFELVGFYRETGKIDGNYLTFAEASLNISNQGYREKSKKDLIYINKERSLKTVGEKEVNNPFNGTVKGIAYAVLANDIVKHPGAIFGEKYLSKYNYTLSGMTTVNGAAAYVIAFDQKEGIKAALYEGTVVVTATNFAIVKLDFKLSRKGMKYAEPDISWLQRPILSLLGYHFEKLDEELSLRYMEVDQKWYPYFYKISTTHQVKARKQKIDGALQLNAELFISKINLAPVVQTGHLQLMPDNYSFQHNVKTYEDAYWGDYDYIKPTESLKSLAEKMNRNE